MARSFDPHAHSMAVTEAGDLASESRLLYRWTGTHWQVVDEEMAERDANMPGHASANNARRGVRSAALFLPRLPEMTTEVVIPVLNGYVRIENGAARLVPVDRSLGLRHVLTCEFDPAARAPLFERFLSRALPDIAVQRRVQEYVGYTFLADARYQLAQLWLGPGANGKGVFANIVQALHGNTAAISLDALEGSRLSVLVGASLIYVDEVPRTRINEQLVKSMIAGERVQIDRKHRDPLSIRIRGKWILRGNHLPAVSDHSTRPWRRWDIIPFGETVPLRERDPLLSRKIVDRELAGVLNWALEGLVRLTARGGFETKVPEAMRIAMQEARADTNAVAAWSDEYIPRRTGRQTPPGPGRPRGHGQRG